jgi:peptidoglycan/xylan/chitin deacetylase (PgdA/CDA1 family)
MRLSVVVPAYNERDSIRCCLDSLAAQRTSYPFEVIVVDNNSTDGTAAEAASYPFVRVVREGRQGVASARQAGLEVATGEVVAQLDADTEAPCDWLDRIGRAFEADRDLVLVTGPIAFPSGPWLACLIQSVLNWIMVAWWLLTGRLAAVNGCNFAVRAGVLAAAGGIPVDLPEAGDSRILGVLRRRGRVALLRGCAVRTSPRRFLKQGVLRVYGFYLLEQIASLWGWCPRGIMSRPAVRLSELPSRRRSVSRRLLRVLPILPAVAAAAGCTYMAFNPRSQVYGRIVVHGPRSQKVVALTFDDGPNEPYTSEIQDILDSYGIKATFFETAENVEYYPQTTERLLADGQVIGNHSYDHSRLATAVDFRYREVDQAQSVFQSVTGLAPTLFRPPYGFHTPWQMRTVSDARMITVNWDIEGLDWQKDATADSIADRVLSGVQPGSIILLHDGDETQHFTSRAPTVEALPRIIETLRARGYRFVTVPQLLGVPAYQEGSAGIPGAEKQPG